MKRACKHPKPEFVGDIESAYPEQWCPNCGALRGWVFNPKKYYPRWRKPKGIK